MRLFFLMAFIFWSIPATAEPLRCEPVTKHFCSGGICEMVKPTTWNIVWPTDGKISRCDNQGCDIYEADVYTSGIFIILEVAGRGFLLKMERDGSSYIEVATLGTDVYLSYGQCKEEE